MWTNVYLWVFCYSKQKNDAGSEITDLVLHRPPRLSNGISSLNIFWITRHKNDKVKRTDHVRSQFAREDQGGVPVRLNVSADVSRRRLVPVFDRVVDEDVEEQEGEGDDRQWVADGGTRPEIEIGQEG